MAGTISPTYITFDCYGTLTNFQMTSTVRDIATDRVSPEDFDAFVHDFRMYRADEVIGEFKLYPLVLRDSWQRTCNRWRVQFKQSDVDYIIDSLASWGPHEDVVQPLVALAEKYPLVILSNAVDGILAGNVAKLGVDFHRVYTAEQARAYKPRLQAFEYMIDQLGARPDELLHISSHIWYDLIPADDLGIKDMVYIDRGYDPLISYPGLAMSLADVVELVEA